MSILQYTPVGHILQRPWTTRKFHRSPWPPWPQRHKFSGTLLGHVLGQWHRPPALLSSEEASWFRSPPLAENEKDRHQPPFGSADFRVIWLDTKWKHIKKCLEGLSPHFFSERHGTCALDLSKTIGCFPRHIISTTPAGLEISVRNGKSAVNRIRDHKRNQSK